MPLIQIEAPLDLELRVEPNSNGIVLHCKGQITTGPTCLALRSAVKDLLHRHPTIVVDLSEVHRLDRRGLEVLVSLYPSARSAGSTLKYVNLRTQLRDSDPRKQQQQKLAS